MKGVSYDKVASSQLPAVRCESAVCRVVSYVYRLRPRLVARQGDRMNLYLSEALILRKVASEESEKKRFRLLAQLGDMRLQDIFNCEYVAVSDGRLLPAGRSAMMATLRRCLKDA